MRKYILLCDKGLLNIINVLICIKILFIIFKFILIGFNDYYIYLMNKLDEVYEQITGDTSLVVYKRSLWQIVLSKLSKLFRRANETVFGDVAKKQLI